MDIPVRGQHNHETHQIHERDNPVISRCQCGADARRKICGCINIPQISLNKPDVPQQQSCLISSVVYLEATTLPA